MNLAFKDWAWHRVAVVWLMTLLLSAYTVIVQTGLTSSFFYNVIISFWSAQVLLLLPMLLLISANRFLVGGSLALLIFMFLWQLASLELYASQCRVFSFTELLDLTFTWETLPLVLEQLVSFKVFFFIGCFACMYLGAVYLIEKKSWEKHGFYFVPLVLILFIIGQWQVNNWGKKLVFRDQRICCMPWSSMSIIRRGDPVALFAVAKELWHKNESPEFSEGPHASVALLKAAFPNRNIVVILLESHGLVNVEGFGEGSERHKASSPQLSQLCQENMHFTNYYQTGYATNSAAWSILSGFPFFVESTYTPHLLSLGPAQDFKDAGYHLEWLKAANIKFAHFNELAEKLDMPAGVTKEEGEEYWQKDNSLWKAWGMPDEQLFEIALSRYREHQKTRKDPYLQFVLTVSNHIPFVLPRSINGHELAEDFSGGMYYADYHMKKYVDQLRNLPIDERPVIFITGDTGFRLGEVYLGEDEEYMVEPLESMRLPAVLILPEHKSELPSSYDHIFAHQDLLPYLANIVGVSTRFDKRIHAHHRVGLGIEDFDTHSIIYKNHYLFSADVHLKINQRWNLSLDLDHENYTSQAEEVRAFYEQLRNRVWVNGGVHTNYRWDNKHLIYSSIEPK